MKCITSGLVWIFLCFGLWKTEATFQQQQQQQQQDNVNLFDLMRLTSTLPNTANDMQAPTNAGSPQNDGLLIEQHQQQQQQQQQQMQQPTLPPGTQTGGCTVDMPQAAECLKNAALDMISSFFFFVFDQSIENLVDDVCWKFPPHEQCIHQSLGSCGGPQRIKYDVALAAFNFVCSSTGRLAVQEAWPCLSDRSVGQHLRVCSEQIANTAAFYNPCLTASQYVNCVSITFQERCTLRSANAVKDLLSATLRPFNTFFDCPSAEVATTLPPPTTTTTTTTTTTSTTTDLTSPDTTEAVTKGSSVSDGSHVQCYDCTTGARGLWENPDCTDTGYVDQSTVNYVTCETPCFARVSKGAVTRGCATGYNGTFQGKFDLNRCETLGEQINMEVWCFCDTPGCNVQDMTPHYNEFIP